ncbi:MULTISPECIES: hypothetical protein [unclassified Streptomyces]
MSVVDLGGVVFVDTVPDLIGDAGVDGVGADGVHVVGDLGLSVVD